MPDLVDYLGKAHEPVVLGVGIVLVAALTILALAPYLMFMRHTWEIGRNRIIAYFCDPDVINMFFQHFPSDAAACPGNDGDKRGIARKRFSDYYNNIHGKKLFRVPALIFGTLVIAVLLLIAVLMSPLALSPGTELSPTMMTIVFAAAGGYFRVVVDQIDDAYTRTMSAHNLYFCSVRLVLAIPFGIAFGMVLEAPHSALGPVIALMMSALPTRTIFRWSRRFLVKYTKIEGDDEGDDLENELQRWIQGIDREKAERFSREGVTTVVQLAYANPVRLAVRLNIDVPVIVDYINQALLRMYLRERLDTVAKLGFRGAQESSNFYRYYLRLEGTLGTGAFPAVQPAGSPTKQVAGMDVDGFQMCAKETIEKAAALLEMPVNTLLLLLAEVAHDPFTDFIEKLWAMIYDKEKKDVCCTQSGTQQPAQPAVATAAPAKPQDQAARSSEQGRKKK